MKLLLAVLALAAAMLVFFGMRKMRAATSTSADPYQTKDIYLGLRDRAFQSTAKELGVDVKKEEAFGVLVDIGMREAAVTVAVFKTGDASLYFSNGGGQIGGIGHEEIRNAVYRVIVKANGEVARMKTTTEFPVVQRGRIRVYVLTPNGVLLDEADEARIFKTDSPASVLFAAIQDVISGFRHLPQAKE